MATAFFKKERGGFGVETVLLQVGNGPAGLGYGEGKGRKGGARTLGSSRELFWWETVLKGATEKGRT